MESDRLETDGRNYASMCGVHTAWHLTRLLPAASPFDAVEVTVWYPRQGVRSVHRLKRGRQVTRQPDKVGHRVGGTQ